MAAWKLQWKRWRRKQTEDDQEIGSSNHDNGNDFESNVPQSNSQFSDSEIRDSKLQEPAMTLQYKFTQIFVKTGRIQYEKFQRAKFCSLVRAPRGSMSTLLNHCDLMNVNKQFLGWSYDMETSNPSILEKLYRLLIQLSVEIFYIYENQLTNIHTPCPKKVDPFRARSQERLQELQAIQAVAEFAAKKCFEKLTNPKFQDWNYGQIIHEALTSVWPTESCTTSFSGGRKMKLHWILGKGQEREVYAIDLIREPLAAYYRSNGPNGVDGTFKVKGRSKDVRELEPKYKRFCLTNLLRRPFEFEWDQISKMSEGQWTDMKSALKIEKKNEERILEINKIKSFVWKDLTEEVTKMLAEVCSDPIFVELKALELQNQCQSHSKSQVSVQDSSQQSLPKPKVDRLKVRDAKLSFLSEARTSNSNTEQKDTNVISEPLENIDMDKVFKKVKK